MREANAHRSLYGMLRFPKEEIYPLKPIGSEWEKHTPYHYSQNIDGKRLDYWPSKLKVMFDGKVMIFANSRDVTKFLSKTRGEA